MTPLLNERQSLRSFLDKSGKGKEERGKRKQETGTRKQETGNRKKETGKRKAESGKRKEESGKRREERGKRKLKKVLSVTKHGFVFRAQSKPNASLEIYKAFQDRLTFLNLHMIVWIGWDF